VEGSFLKNDRIISIIMSKRSLISAEKFIQLPDGLMTHYELLGPKNAQTVVLIHGFSVPYYNLDHTFNFLVKSGFRVLRYDIYGRGLSDKPITEYSKDFYYKQLKNLLSALKINSQIDFIGFSMGAIIAAFFANRHSKLIRRICFISPAGMPTVVPIALNAIKLPGVGEMIMSLFGNKILTSGIKIDLCHPKNFPEYFKKYIPQLKDPGFKHSLLSTFRDGTLFNSENEYKELGKKNIRTLLIWGKKDKAMPYKLHEKVIDNIPNIKFYGIDGAGHASPYEFPEKVNPVLLDFFK